MGCPLRLPLAAQLALAAALWSCGGAGGSSAGPSGGTETRTFMGTTRALSATSCTGDSHDFVAGEGPVSVTLVQTTGGTALVVQVCAGGIDNGDCTINQTPIAVNQTVRGTRRGGATQNLKLLPLNCGGGGPIPDGPIVYTATVTFQR